MIVNVEDFVKQINIIAQTGLPIRLTEFDTGKGISRKDQAENVVKIMKIAFSHPSINGLIFWS